jgi:hypothetical protein
VLGIACGSGTTCKNYDLNSASSQRSFVGTYSCTQEATGTEACTGWYMCSGATTLYVTAEGSKAKIYSDDCWWNYYEYDGGVCEPEKNSSSQDFFTFYGTHIEDTGHGRVRSTINGQIISGVKTTATANITLYVTPDLGQSCQLHGRLTCECNNCGYY